MAKEYLEKLTAFVEEVTSSSPEISRNKNIKLAYKHFFSGAALYVNHRICITLTPVGLAIKLPEDTKTELLDKKKAVPLKYFPKSPVKKDYALFPDGFANDRSLHPYIKESIEYVITLPKPKIKKK